MSIIEQLADMLDSRVAGGYAPVCIEIGTKQAEAIADELGHHILPRPYTDDEISDPLWGTADLPRSRKVTAGDILTGGGYLFEVRLQGVESPDYLNVVTEAR